MEEVVKIFLEKEVHYRDNKSPPPVSIFSGVLAYFYSIKYETSRNVTATTSGGSYGKYRAGRTKLNDYPTCFYMYGSLNYIRSNPV